MAYAMTKRGSLDNCITYEFICDTIQDMNAIEDGYRTIGTVAIVLSGADEGLEVYMSGSDHEWVSLSSMGTSGGATIDLSAYAPKASPVFTGSISMERKTNSTVGANSVATGTGVIASGANSHAEGQGVLTEARTIGQQAYTHGGAFGANSHAEGDQTLAIGLDSHAEGFKSVAFGEYDHAEGYDTFASGTYGAHAEGYQTQASNYCAHAEGYLSVASGAYAHAEGYGTAASGDYSAHAEGEDTTASGYSGAHAEGYETTASGDYGSHAEGYYTQASGSYGAHAEGAETSANGEDSHAEGSYTSADGKASHTEGVQTRASGDASHASGTYNIADSYTNWSNWAPNTAYQVGDKVKHTISGNTEGYICKTTHTSGSSFTGTNWINHGRKMNYVEIIGNGTTDNARSNARALDWDGNEHLKGDVYVNCNADSTGGTKLIGLPTPPVSDGTYTLQVIVSSGTATYSWVGV